jgi:hypothetical protein
VDVAGAPREREVMLMEFTDVEAEFLIFCLTLSVKQFTENAQLMREEPNQKLKPLAFQFDDNAARATALIERLTGRPS